MVLRLWGGPAACGRRNAWGRCPQGPQGGALEPLSSAGGAGRPYSLSGPAPAGGGFGPRAEFLSAPPERNQRAGDSAACGRRDAPPIMRPRFRLRATYFSHGRKVGKSPHRGSASDSTWSQGRSMLIVGHPPMYPPVYGGAKLVPVSNDRRTVSTLCAPLGGLRPGATKLAPLLRRLWAPAFGVQACGSAPLTAHKLKCFAVPGGYPGPQAPKRKNAGGRRPSMEPAQPRVTHAGKRGTHPN